MYRSSSTMLRRSSSTMQRSSGTMQKSTENVWLSDTGCYPIIIVIGTSVILPVIFGLHMIVTSPDSRISKHSRKAFLRGEFKEIHH
jgi:hypothetical protein